MGVYDDARYPFTRPNNGSVALPTQEEIEEDSRLGRSFTGWTVIYMGRPPEKRPHDIPPPDLDEIRRFVRWQLDEGATVDVAKLADWLSVPEEEFAEFR